MNIRKIEAEEYVPLLLCAAGTLGILPFALMRLMNGEWLIGIIDMLIVILMGGLGIFMFRTQKVRVANICLAALVVSGALTTVYLKGPMQVFWTFPAFMVVFYILKPKEALLLVLLGMLVLIPALNSHLAHSFLAASMVTLAITVSIAYSFAIQNIRQQRKLMSLATLDPLTGTGNRRAFEQELKRVTALKNRGRVPCSMLLIDLDRFKRINDEFGHAVGDSTLINVCQLIQERIRLTDGLYRIGGEEFVVIINNDHIKDAQMIAEELRRSVERCANIPDIRTTISVGVAELVTQESSASWLRRADEALYRAKENGRNLVQLAPFPKNIAIEPTSKKNKA